jgi:hypothetical protein
MLIEVIGVRRDIKSFGALPGSLFPASPTSWRKGRLRGTLTHSRRLG